MGPRYCLGLPWSWLLGLLAGYIEEEKEGGTKGESLYEAEASGIGQGRYRYRYRYLTIRGPSGLRASFLILSP